MWVIGAIAIIGIGFSIVSSKSDPKKYDAFAQYLKDKGAVFYSAFWCPHCQDQKKHSENQKNSFHM